MWLATKAFPRIVPVAYVCIFAALPKGRLVLVILAPFIALTLAPFTLMWLTGVWVAPLVTLTALNAVFCT